VSDLSYWKRINREYYSRFFRMVDVYIYDRGLKDPLYGEALDKTYGEFSPDGVPTYQVEAYFPELPEWNAILTKFGLDSKRELKAYFFAHTFEENKLTPPHVGDHLVVQGYPFKVIQDNIGDYFGNSQIPMSYYIVLQPVRPESIQVRPRTAEEDDIYPESDLRKGVQE